MLSAESLDVAPPPSPPPSEIVARPPVTVEETGLEFAFLADLTLKTVYADANCTTERIAEKLKLSPHIADAALQHLYREKFLEIRGTEGHGNRRYGMLDRGWDRAHRLLDVKWLHRTGPRLAGRVHRDDPDPGAGQAVRGARSGPRCARAPGVARRHGTHARPREQFAT